MTPGGLEDLAWERQAAGLLDEAIPLWESLVAERERTLGTDHPDTVATREYLAIAAAAAAPPGPRRWPWHRKVRSAADGT